MRSTCGACSTDSGEPSLHLHRCPKPRRSLCSVRSEGLVGVQYTRLSRPSLTSIQVKLVFDEYAEDEAGQRAVSKDSLAGIADDLGGSASRPALREM